MQGTGAKGLDAEGGGAVFDISFIRRSRQSLVGDLHGDIFEFAGQGADGGQGGGIIDGPDGGAQGHRVALVAVDGNAIAGRDIHRGGASVWCRARRIHQAGGQQSRRAVPVGGGVEAQAVGVGQIHTRSGADTSTDGGPASAAIGRIFPHALGGGGGIAHHHNAGHGLRRTAVNHLVGSIAVDVAEQAGDGGAGGGVFIGGSQQHARLQGCRGIVGCGHNQGDGVTHYGEGCAVTRDRSVGRAAGGAGGAVPGAESDGWIDGAIPVDGWLEVKPGVTG